MTADQDPHWTVEVHISRIERRTVHINITAPNKTAAETTAMAEARRHGEPGHWTIDHAHATPNTEPT